MVSANPPPTPPASGRGVRKALAEAAARFVFSETARLDAELLMAHALGVSREALLLRHLDDPPPAGFAALVARRAAHEPIAYITGTRAFWTIDLGVGPGVLIPRADSETLIEAAVDHFGGRAPTRILDLGTGPGTLLLAALAQWPEAQGLGIDTSERAWQFFEENVAALEMDDRARFKFGDWAADTQGAFDLILANPPYIATTDVLPPEVSEYEPAAALFAGPDGLDAYRVIAPQLPALLAPGGVAILEIGATQSEAVTALLAAQGLTVALRHDLAGRPRALIAA
ncbi:MAG: peptide chain release factor N(5)-glutamine methyltransferase [Sphingomonas sp.]|uniref:peptide chain release factor N(5)-glutamine methyltransferase n=1 Tax=Sphingomonas sp. TaxID=28214 RepID=UPI003564BE37